MEHPDITENLNKHTSDTSPLIVGIGASAGGIEALITFFENVPPDQDIAYVVVLHLSPDYESELAKIIQGVTFLHVHRLERRVRIERDHVYVMSPSQHLKMVDGHIDVLPIVTLEERRAPVDIFFRTLAESHGSNSIAVILSGTGANGSMGLKRIKENGGAVFVQNPREAGFGEMPRNAIATDLVDDILPVAEMPAKIISFKKTLGAVEIKLEPEKRPEQDQQALREIFAQLRIRTGHDFSNYKRATILRRIERRMSVRGLLSLTTYAQYLRETPEEAHALLKDLLISVTNFFRDRDAFEHLEKDVIPRILERKNNEDNIRIWVAGCATGEEAYSLAMLFSERSLTIDSPKIQIFASDIDENAIAIAREGLYTLNDAADVSPERLHRFFIAEPDGYRVKRDIREMILFANHNLIKDPPFSHVDLVTCRNLLIYFNSTAQERVMETVHFALKPGGFFFLGGSESVTGASDLFMLVSKEANIFQSRPLANRISYPVPEATHTLRYNKETIRTNQLSAESRETKVRERMTYGDLHQQLLEQYAPPSLVVNEEYDIVHLSEKAGRYMQVAGGEPTQNLLKLIRPELRLELRSALYQAVQQQANIRAKGLTLVMDGKPETLDVHIRPVLSEENGARGFILLVFETVTGTEGETEVTFASPEPMTRQLEDELVRTKSQLRNSSEQFEVQAEELKASNEELQAMNEELRSAAEELETSKEELQSINEELVTVNQELKIKIDELSQTNNNFQNLVNSTDIPTVFLDRTLHVNMFTPASREVYNLIPFDIGRPISAITSRLLYTSLTEDARLVLQKLQNVEKEIVTTDGKTFFLRMSPYRTAEDRISGVVMVFIDITDRITAEEALAKAHTNLTMALEATRAGWGTWNLQTAEVEWSEEAKKLIGFGAGEESRTFAAWEARIHPNDLAAIKTGLANAIAEHKDISTEYRILKPDGSIAWLLATGNIQYNAKGTAVSCTGIILDITERKQAEQAIRESKERFRLLAEASSDSLYRMSPDWSEMYSLDGKEFLANTSKTMAGWLHFYLPDSDKARAMEAIKKAIRNKTPFELEHRVIRADGAIGWTSSRAVPLLDENGDITEWFGAASDITERKRAEQNLGFIAEISQDLVPVINISEAINKIGEKTGRFFNVRHCVFVDQTDEFENSVATYGWSASNAVDIRGTYRTKEYLTDEAIAILEAGDPLVVSDTQTDKRVSAMKYAALNIRSFIVLPFSRSSDRQFLMSVIDDKPRNWRPDEIELARELTFRIWTRLERARAEEALQYSETRLRIVAKSSGIGTWIRHLDKEGIEADDRTKEIFGVALEDYSLADSVRLVLHEDDLNDFTDAFERAVDPNGNGVLNIEFRIYRPDDGSLRWLHSVGQTFFEGNPKNAVMMVGSTVDITERKESGEAIRESEERYRALFNQATAGVVEMDVEGNVILANDTYCHSLRYTNEEMLSLNIRDLIHQDDLDRSLNLFNETVKSGYSFSNEKRLIRADGSCIWVTDSISAVKDEKGNTVSVLCVGIDITERKQTEIFVRESEDRYRIALEAGELATWDWNLKTDKVTWNTQHFRLFGVDHDGGTIDPEYFLEFVYPEDLALVKQQLIEVVGSKGVYSAEFRIRRRDNNKLRWMNGYGRITERENGKPTRVSGVMFDSTDRREAEDNLEATKNSLNTALEAAKMGVWSKDMTHGHMDRSPKHDELPGFDDWQDEWDDDKARTHIIEEDKSKFDTAWQNLIENGVFDLEARINHTDGSTCWIHYFGRTFRNEDGKGETAAGVIYDITDQKTIEKQKDEFLGIASHELKTPVTSIKAYAEILQEMFEEVNDKKSAELMGKLDSQVDRLTKLIKDLLDVTKVSEGQLHLITRSFNVVTTIENVTEEMQRTTRSHRIKLTIESLPEVVGDEERIAQVLVNMMSNAIKYSPEAKEVLVNAKYEGGKVSVSVQDFGIGMSPGTLEKLFARFFRSDNPTIRSFPGLGLGLFISMEIMKRHNGTISVQSERGKGSIFTMVLPVL